MKYRAYGVYFVLKAEFWVSYNLQHISNPLQMATTEHYKPRCWMESNLANHVHTGSSMLTRTVYSSSQALNKYYLKATMTVPSLGSPVLPTLLIKHGY